MHHNDRLLVDAATVADSGLTDGSTVVASIPTCAPSLSAAPLSGPPPLSLDDPRVPDWVRFPQEEPAYSSDPTIVAMLIGIGLPVRVARNAARVSLGDPDKALLMVQSLLTEADNAAIEAIALEGSGLLPGERARLMTEWVFHAMAQSEAPVQEVVPIAVSERPVTARPQDLVQFFGATDVEQQLLSTFPGISAAHARALADFIEAVDDAEGMEPGGFTNPFMAFGLVEGAIDAVFGERLPFCACLPTDACMFLLTRYRQGADFEELCEVLAAADFNIETAAQLLLDDGE